MSLPQDRINTASRSAVMKGRRRSSTVSFSPKSEMCLVDKHENKSDLFYSTQEINTIKQQRVRDSYNLVQCNIAGQDLVDMNMLKNNVSDTSAFLGLEICLSKATYVQTIMKRRASIEAVISEQHRQLSLDVYDPNTLANVSGAESAWARERARTIALIHSD
jgi:hypothetical protein